ncbi:FkbM family methyltransferase [Reichenbachiella sp.]|uniref:FkbM family methyltransferase n=1 Tax=Reichenbachiella sp. TaxID=2184521 RepID=UPI003B5B15AF
MRHFLSRGFLWLARILQSTSNRLSKNKLTLRQKNAIEWHKIKGDSSLRLNYPLSKDSIVLDCGGFEGQWASDIYSMYQPKIYIFEPVNAYFQEIEKRFSANKDITVINKGIGGKSESLNIKIGGNESSFHLNGDNEELVEIESFSDFINRESIKEIDLMKINIEGAEYDLLKNIIENDMHYMIKNIQVQFHDFVDNYDLKMRQIRTELLKSHELTYEYPLIWENWKRKN